MFETVPGCLADRFRRSLPAVLFALFAIQVCTPSFALDVLPHAPAPDVLPTYDGSGEVVEPDVIFVPGGWHDYEYWMAMTPYTCGDETTENPSILASHDGRNWEVPRSGTLIAPAPLVGNSSPCYPFAWNNNDPTIVLAGDSLFIYYAVTYVRYGPKAGTTEIRRIASPDGIHWTPGDLAPVMWTRPNYLLSPTVTTGDGGFYAWYVQLSRCDAPAAELHRRWSPDGVSWAEDRDEIVSMDASNGVIYHVTVKNVGDVYAMLYVAYPSGGDCNQANTLYYAESADGANWLALPMPMMTPSPSPGAWDDRQIYRSSFVGRYPTMKVWYSAHGDSACTFCGGAFAGSRWHVGFTEIENHFAPLGLDVDTTAVVFDPVIASATRPQRSLSVHHVHRFSPDDIRYSISASSGFRAVPDGSFSLPVGLDLEHSLEMETDVPGIKSGAVVIASNAVGDPMRVIRMSGSVLRHAVGSLDSTRLNRAGTLSFGRRPAGTFAPRPLRVHNLGASPLQSELLLSDVEVEGGAGRFTIDGGFRPTQLARASTLSILFDDRDATPDSTYEATLRITNGDQLLPGSQLQPALVVTLTATVSGDDYRGPATAPGLLAAAYPNPLVQWSVLRFALARPTTARLDVYDVGGRRVATLAEGRFDAGPHEVRWSGRLDDGARAGPGQYFVRLTGEGLPGSNARLTVER